MDDALPVVPISPDHIAFLMAALLVYQQFRQRKTPPSEERRHTLSVLLFLLPKLQRGIEPHEGELPLWLTVDEVSVIKGGLTMMLDQLKRKPASRQITQEIARLKQLKTLFDQHFSTTQD